MKQERKLLEDNIFSILTELNKTGNIKELIDSNLLNEYMELATVTKILNLNLTLNILSIEELYHITRLINSYKLRIKVEEYFTDEEITSAIENKNNLKLKSNPLITLKNTIYSRNKFGESWLCKVKYQEIYDWVKSGKLGYNMATQRRGVSRRIKGKIITIPYVNEKSTAEIKLAMKKDEFYSNMIGFNVTPDFDHRLDYDKVDGTLIIDPTIFEIAVIDGWHRISAIVSLVDEDKNFDGELYLKVTNMNIQKAQLAIRQQAKTNPMDDEYFEKFDPDNKVTKFITDINELLTEDTNFLYGKIDIGTNTPNTLLTFELFKEGLDLSNYLTDIDNINSEIELKKMEKFIVNFVTSFYTLVKENKITNEDKIKVLTDPTFIMGLLIASRKYYKENDIDLESMTKFIKKFKNSDTKYTFEYPLKVKDRQKMIDKFKDLLGVKKGDK